MSAAVAGAAGGETRTQRAWRAARRVLAVRLDNLGDLLMTTPALAAIKHSAPGMHLTLLGSGAGAAMHGLLPAIDDAIAYDAPWVKGGGGMRDVQADHALIERLAQGRFDAAVIFTVCTQSALPAALLCRLAGIPLRLAHSRENPYELLTDWLPDTEVCATGMRHEVQRQLALVAAVGFHADDDHLRLRYRVSDVLSLRRKLAEAGADLQRPYVVVHPGASAASRRWPAERFGLAADAIAAATDCQVVFCGGADEAPLVARACAAMRMPGVSLVGRLSLAELAALIAGAQVTLCNNSGPAHIAAAVGAPVVVVYALTNPQHTPWKTRSRVLNHDVPCRHCLKSVCPEGHHACIDRVPPEAVSAAALELLDTLPGVPLHAAAPVPARSTMAVAP